MAQKVDSRVFWRPRFQEYPPARADFPIDDKREARQTPNRIAGDIPATHRTKAASALSACGPFHAIMSGNWQGQ